MRKKTLLTFIFTIPLIGCSIFNNSYGTMRASVKFPDRSFNIKVIPDNTSLILVKVSGQGLNEPVLFELNRDNTSKLLNNIPEGDKKVNASALDEEGNIIAKGENSVNVIAQQLNTVEVELKLNDKLIASPTPSPEPIECKIELEKRDLPLPDNLLKAIENAGCKIITKEIEEPEPTSSSSIEPSISSSIEPIDFSSSSGGSSDNNNSSNIKANISIIDGEQKDSPNIIINNNQKL